MINTPFAPQRLHHKVLDQLKKRRRSEVEKLSDLLRFDEEARRGRYTLVAGIDEAGRGPLAGPVVAAVVVLPLEQLVKYFEWKKICLASDYGKEMSFTSEKVRPQRDKKDGGNGYIGLTNDERVFSGEGKEFCLVGLNDSKKLTPTKRKALSGRIKRVALDWAIGMSSEEEISRENIYRASFLAMKRAIERLRQYQVAQASCLWLVDGFKIPGLEIPQMAIIGGDGLSANIAAASILAKVTRDELMEHYHEMYPQYGFKRHKGYATREHLEMLKLYGPCPIHRLGFQPVKEVIARGK